MYRRQKLKNRPVYSISLIEVLVALFCMVVLVLMVGTAVPLAIRGNQNNQAFMVATTACLHKLRQCQAAGFTAMTGPLLGQSGRQIVDGTPTTPASNSGGGQTGSFAFTDTDTLWKVMPSGLNPDGTKNTGTFRPQGSLTIAPYTPSLISGTNYGLIQVTATVLWYDTRNLPHRISMHTMVPREPM